MQIAYSPPKNVFTDDNAQFNIDAEVTNYFSNGDDTSTNKHGCLKRGSELKDFVKTDRQ